MDLLIRSLEFCIVIEIFVEKCGDVVLAYKYFVDALPEEERDDCVLIFHCAPSDPNGTDLPRVCRHLMPDYNVAFTYTINNGQPFDDKVNESII